MDARTPMADDGRRRPPDAAPTPDAARDPHPSPVIRASSLAAQVYEELRRRITEGRLAESAPLVIAVLVREFGVSQTPVREALARLHAEGLAAFVENVGYRVAVRPSSADYGHWMEARLVIEVNAIRVGAGRATPDALAALRAINGRIRATEFGQSFEGIRQFAELNAAFHRAIIEMAGNPFLLRAYDQIWLGAQFSRVHYRRGVTDRDRIATEHEAIIDAIAEAAAERAASAMEAHIVDSLERDRRRIPTPDPIASGERQGAEHGEVAGSGSRRRARQP